MSTVIDYIGSFPPANMDERLTDLDSVKRQIRIARLKLGSILDAFDRVEASPLAINMLLESTGDVATSIDRLVEVMSSNVTQDDSDD